ncbi:MAG: FkbM family methyltransferase [Nitrospira sp.]
MTHLKPILEYRYRRRLLGIAKSYLRRQLFRHLTRNSVGLFMLGGDLLSVSPQLSELHEPALASFLDACASAGFDDFFFDIGANIGLTSCQSGSRFKFVHMFEPNPLCCSILRVNAAVSLEKGAFVVHEHGLGATDCVVSLNVPRSNWGGAFIWDAGNAYGEKLLAMKDGYSSVDPKNYFTILARIRNTTNELSRHFDSLASRGMRAGVLKLDVEGYEFEILKGIAAALPSNLKVVIIFESWDPALPIQDILRLFSRKVTAHCLYSDIFMAKRSRMRRAMSAILNGGETVSLGTTSPERLTGDIVLIAA